MSRKFSLFLALLAAFSASASAAPVSLKELEFMVRMHTSEAEILGDLAQRRLLSPLNEAMTKALVADGASAAFIAKIKEGPYVLPPDVAAEFRQRVTEQTLASARQDARERAEYEERQRHLADGGSDVMVKLFEGKLLKFEDGAPRAFAADQLRPIKTFALYFGSHWSVPSQNFTLKLIEAYNKLKAVNPTFELIYVSNDKTEPEMMHHMLDEKMPWPAVQYKKRDAGILQYGAGSVPWLILVDGSGVPIYQKKSPDGRYTMVDPHTTLGNLETLLGGHRLNPASLE